jgi:hypothetical protein
MSVFQMTVHGLLAHVFGKATPLVVGQLSIEHATADDYAGALKDLQAAADQMRELREKGFDGCAVCGDSGHHAGLCHHNPLLLAVLGGEALLGAFWKCFHCGAIYTDEAHARNHFGDRPDEPAKCQIRDAQRQGYEAGSLDVATSFGEIFRANFQPDVETVRRRAQLRYPNDPNQED